ncbi:MAG: PEP-CTERM sorting domain-containing protein [bacterium]|nr:PEP-CTERM sorting domain-containing protein [bacterium]
MRSLREVLVSDFGLDLAGWSLTIARDVTADGRVVTGWGTNPNGNQEAWIAVIPEPSMLMLLALSVVAVLGHQTATRPGPGLLRA